MPFTPGPLKTVLTCRTHNHPERFWETTLSSLEQSVGPVLTAHGETKEEAEATASFFALAPEMFKIVKRVAASLPGKDANCHSGITTQEQCGRCREILEAIRLVESIEEER